MNNLDQFRAGDEKAVMEAWQANERALGHFVAHKVNGMRDDVMQEIFLRVWQHTDQFRGETPEKLRAWLFRIAINRIREMTRSKAHKIERDMEDVHEYDDSRSWHRIVPDSLRYKTEERDERLDMLPELILQLPEIEMEMMTRRLSGQGYEEIAESTGKTTKAVKSCLHRARNRLKTFVS